MHHFGHFDAAALGRDPRWAGHSEGYRHASLVDHATGSVHTGLSIDELAPGGTLAPHVHSYEESFYVLAGEAMLSVSGQVYRVRARRLRSDQGRNGACAGARLGPTPVRWLQMAAPQPKPAGQERDTFFAQERDGSGRGATADLEHLDGNLLGHFDVGQIPPGDEGRIVAGGLEGVFLKWLIDENFGARTPSPAVHRVSARGVASACTTIPIEEAYFILSGEVEATMDGERYLARRRATCSGPASAASMRSPTRAASRYGGSRRFRRSPRQENVFRFMAEWEQRARELEGKHHDAATSRTRPFTGAEYLESLRDGREIWIYGERVKDVTTHPAFRNTVRMIARLYDALHDPARKDDAHDAEPTPAAAATRTSSSGRRETPRSWWPPAMPSPNGRASPMAGSAGARTTRRRFWRRSAPTRPSTRRTTKTRRRWYTKVQEEVSFVNHAIVNPPVDRDRPLDEVKDVYMHVEEETDGGLIVSGAKVVATTSSLTHLQLHRQQRRAADQDEAVRLRLHRADRRARREAVLPAVVRDDGGGDGHAVRLSALEPDGRERLDPGVRQGVRAVGERVRVRRHREGEQLLPALRVPAAIHVPGLHAPGREAGLPRRAAAQGGRGDRRQGLPRRAGAGRRSARLAQPVLGAHRRDGADDDAVDRRATCCRISTTASRIA